MAYLNTQGALLDKSSNPAEHLYAQAAGVETLLQQIAQSLVDSPDQVRVSRMNGDHTTVLELRVAKEDLGKVIGKRGRTAQAIRTLLSAVSAKNRNRVVMEIVE